MLAKGVKTLAMSLGVLILSPVILSSAFKNKEHFMFIVVLIIGVIFMLLAIFLILRGIKLILNSFLD